MKIMRPAMPYSRDMISPDFYSMVVDMVDQAFMLFYRHIRRNARRIAHLLVTLLPLMMLLVGSCKTSQFSLFTGSHTVPEQFRMALFPDQLNAQNPDYRPAAGYIARARSFIADTPANLMLLTQKEIGYLFGKPTLHRHDANAVVMQYKTDSCVVDFYFYDEKSHHGKNPLSYVDIRLKDEMLLGSMPRTRPLSADEQSGCLHQVASRGFFSLHA